MTSFKPFDVILVPFPFADLSTQKQRPALLLKTVTAKFFGDLLLCAMVTSQTDGEMIEGDLLLKNWHEAGLMHKSKLRLAKIVTLQKNVVRKKIGHLLVEDQKTVTKLIKKFWESSFKKL